MRVYMPSLEDTSLPRRSPHPPAEPAMSQLAIADTPSDPPPSHTAQVQTVTGASAEPARPVLSITIPAVRSLAVTAPAAPLAPSPLHAAPEPAAPPPQLATAPPIASSRRSMTRQTSRANIQDDQQSPSKSSKSKGKEKAPAPAPEPSTSGPPPAFAVTGFTPPPLDASTIKSLTPMIAQGFADTNDAIARVVRDTTARQLDLSSQIESHRAEQIAFMYEIREELRSAATRTHTIDAPQHLTQIVSDVVIGHNNVVGQVDMLTGSLGQIQATQMQMLERLNEMANAQHRAPQPPAAPAHAEAEIPAVRALKRRRDEDWNQELPTPAAPPTAPAPQAAVPAGPPALPTHALPVAPPPLAVAPPPLPMPIVTHHAPPAPMAVAPPPTSTQIPPPPGPTPGLSVTVGPMRWSKDITGQMRALIAIMPHGQTVSRNVRASRAGANYVYATFPTVADAHHFAAMWNMARPATYENADAQVN